MKQDDFSEITGALSAEKQKQLNLFEENLKAASSGISRQKMENVRLYVKEFLPRKNILTVESGMDSISRYLEHIFIHKCRGESLAPLKDASDSIKEFYKCMMEQEKLTMADYICLAEEIDACMKDWEFACENDFNEEDFIRFYCLGESKDDEYLN